MQRLTFEQEKKLIDYFRDHPSLWNTKDKDYNNRSLRTEKLEVIANQLNLTRKDVYEKYRNLRTTFFREHKRVTHSTSGDADGNNGQRFVSRWRHYHNMLFLTNPHTLSNGDEIGNGGSNGNSTGNGSNISRPGSNIILSNEDSASLQNGHDIELIDVTSGSSHHHHLTAPTLSTTPSEEVILINAQDQTSINGTAIQLTNNVGIVNNQQQRIYSGNSTASNSSASSSATNISALPVTGLSVIQATSANNQAINITTNGRIKMEQTTTSQQQPTFLIKSFIPTFITTTTNSSSGSSSCIASAGATSSSFSATTGSLQPHISRARQTFSGDSISPTAQLVSLQSQPQQSTPPPTARKSSFYFVAAAPPSLQPSSTITTTKDHHSPTSFEPIQQVRSSVSLTSQSPIIENNQSKNHCTSPTFIFANGAAISTSTPLNSSSSNGNFTNSSTNNSFGSICVSNNQYPIRTKNKILDYGEMREVIKNVVQEAIVEYEDEEMAFCRSLAASLRTLDRSKKDVAKLEIQQVIVRYTNPNYSGPGSSSLPSSTSSSCNGDATLAGNCLPTCTGSSSSGDNLTVNSFHNYSLKSESPTTTFTTASNVVSTIMTTGSAPNRTDNNKTNNNNNPHHIDNENYNDNVDNSTASKPMETDNN